MRWGGKWQEHYDEGSPDSAYSSCRLIRVDPNKLLQYQDVNMLGIDDLGEEETTMMDYGNRVTPVIDLLSHRYDRINIKM